jgi:hypothetical protein
MKKPLLVLPLIASLASCATSTESLEKTIPNGPAIARSVILCQTTFAQLREQLGQPSRDGRLGEKRIVTWVTEWDPLTRYLGVALDPNGTVVDVYWDIPSEIPWVPANRCQASEP